MTRKLTIGAVVMALPALALATGPASAQPDPADTGFSQADIALNEIGAELGGNVSGQFIELRNDTNTNYSLAGHVINACDAAGDLDPVVQFESTDFIPANSTYWIADPNWSDPTTPVPNKSFNFGADPLPQAAGGVELVDGFTPVDDVRWGAAGSTDCASFFDAGVTPDDEHSIQPFNPTPPPAWCRAVPTPGGANGPCVL